MRLQARGSTVGLNLCVLLVLLGCLGLPRMVEGQSPAVAEAFAQAAPQGFGDRQNSWAWAMQWWRGHLYVGTNRAWECESQASLYAIDPAYGYPPTDPDIECTADPHDLPLQAEIWRWTPPATWERVYQAPQIPIPGVEGKFVGRDVGYRGMTVFTEADGTEALYVGAVSAKFLGYDVPAPRILRSTDGFHFAPLPQDRGTVLGNFPYTSFRNPISYKGRFYIVGGDVLGAGVLLEADDPRGGNNGFRQISPSNMIVSAVQTFNDYLYVGTRDAKNGYGVFKTAADGPRPYSFQKLIDKGGYVPQLPDDEVLMMRVFDNRLYVGTDATGNFREPSTAGELVRLNADDSWDVVVGEERVTPQGNKAPLSGFGAGFNNIYNRHIWRLEVYDDRLYVGTFDSSTLYRNESGFPQDSLGADLYRSSDGVHYEPVTTTGFGDKFNFGVRSMAATPYGLFVGTANYYYGLKIYRSLRPG